MDELAQAAGQDPLEFRRKLMSKHPKQSRPCSTPSPSASAGASRRRKASSAASRTDGVRQLCRGRGGNLGRATATVKIHRIVGATDPGYAVNPAQIERQIAGSFVYGLSAPVLPGCTVKDGRIEQTNFDSYNSMRIARDAEGRIDRAALRRLFWGGVGEPTIFVAAPAVLNAFFTATGKRIRSFPLKNHGIQMA